MSALGTSVITDHYNCSQTVQGTQVRFLLAHTVVMIVSYKWIPYCTWLYVPSPAGLHWKDVCAHNVIGAY